MTERERERGGEGRGRQVHEVAERNEKSLPSRSRGGKERKNFLDGHRPRDVTHRGRRHRRPTLSISVTVLAARRLIDDRRDGNDISWNAVVVADHFFFLFHVRSTTALPLSLSLPSFTPFSLCISDFFPPLLFSRTLSLSFFVFFLFPSLSSLYCFYLSAGN